MRSPRDWWKLLTGRWWKHHAPPPPLEGDDEDMEDARRKAQEQLDAARARASEVAEVVSESRKHRSDDHFAELMQRAFRQH